MEIKETAQNVRHDTSQDIELRSEKVRKIIGTVPSAPVRWGITVITIIIAALFIAVMCIPYPYGDGETIFTHLFEKQ